MVKRLTALLAVKADVLPPFQVPVVSKLVKAKPVLKHCKFLLDNCPLNERRCLCYGDRSTFANRWPCLSPVNVSGTRRLLVGVLGLEGCLLPWFCKVKDLLLEGSKVQFSVDANPLGRRVVLRLARCFKTLSWAFLPVQCHQSECTATLALPRRSQVMASGSKMQDN